MFPAAYDVHLVKTWNSFGLMLKIRYYFGIVMLEWLYALPIVKALMTWQIKMVLLWKFSQRASNKEQERNNEKKNKTMDSNSSSSSNSSSKIKGM